MQIHWPYLCGAFIGMILLVWKIAYDLTPRGWEDDEGGWHDGDPPGFGGA